MSDMNAAAAREFSESFGMIGAGWWRQIAWATQQGIPDALGLSTREWVEHYVGGWARLAIEDRREAVRELTTAEEDGGMGMSKREAADVLGVDEKTVRLDRAELSAPDPQPLALDDPPAAENSAPDPDHEFRREQLPTIIAGNIAGLKVLAEFTLREITETVPQHRRKTLARRLRRAALHAIKVADHMEKAHV